MQEISKRPMVDILSELTGQQVVMSGEDYVYLSTAKKVTQALLTQATALSVAEQEQESKNKVLDEANTNYANEVSKLTAGVPKEEVLTWTKQEQEARAYLEDATSPTLLIDALALNRGVSKDILVSKIIEKADAYAGAVGVLTGIRQKIEDEL